MTHSDSAFESIEMKIAFLERANTELSDVVYRQQRELDELRAKLAALSTRLDTMKESATDYSLEDERPPHY
jgi:SlyX protein